ncbi:hypothetical protein KUTeg_016564 [Tegillarca granosa]|uniref:Coenzyme PQQ synthesis protein F-like C-terminal lobe domain-containing protein n=1 Tax=Tegillarca granosa TaxID=220873 RepID=A0ABQ9EL70_TEGGR|nr:hypothetical protein KUTeg_016564 [Tegillarca granosa]
MDCPIVQQIDQHIQDFFKEFEVILNETTAEDFTELVDSLVADKLIEDSNLQEETDRHWREICNQTCLFDRHDKEVEILNTLKLETLKGWFTQYLGNAQKAISFQVLGKGDDSDQQQKILSSRIEPIKISVTGGGENSANGYPSFKCLLDKDQTNKPIIDVFTFKNILKALPFTKIVK